MAHKMKSIKSPITLFLLLLGMLSSTTSAFVGPQAKVSRISSALQITKSGGKLIETAEQFTNNVLGKNTPRPVLAFFTAPWCGPCRLSNPVVKEVMKQYSGDIDVVEICTDDLAEVAADAGVMSIPTIQFYHGGKLLDTIVGCVAKSVLANAVEKILDDIKPVAA